MSEQTQNTILAIETSCDETAFSILRSGKTLSHQVHSQADLHAEFGGVFPTLAKREHDKNFTPLLALTLKDAFGISFSPDKDQPNNHNLDEEMIKKIESFLSREDNLAADFISYFQSISPDDFEKIKTNLNAIAVTYGPGLEPALWVGISGAKALATILDLPLYPINHMEGHIASVLASTAESGLAGAIPDVNFPAITLLISGGHTELISITSWHQYTLIGQTVDDAVGEAYDKVARLLGLPYPGGPQISKLAEKWRSEHGNEKSEFTLPRPMIHSHDYNFSFSGLKTACLYAVRDKIKAQDDEPLSQDQKMVLAAEFEQAVVEVLLHKTKQAVEEYTAETLIIGGGVIANQFIREHFAKLCDELNIALFIPEKDLSTDNATMIGLVAHLQISDGKAGLSPTSDEFVNLRANGNLSL
jgi:N6-L-threonylcarbamoyladenine synthase